MSADDGAGDVAPSGGRRSSLRAYFEMRTRAEFIVAAGLFALLLVLRVVNILTWKFETDESQHLHVIWGWARGFVQYRDVCDNHMPLFHLLFAPLYALVGDRPTILFWMRFIILPAYLAAAWATYQIGAFAFSRRVGVWAVLLVGFYPGYALQSLEFRTDNLWAPLWLLCIVVLLRGPFSNRRAAGAGLLLGCCFGVSMKTTLLFVSLVGGAILTALLVPAQRSAMSRRRLALACGMFLLAALGVPGLIMAGFALGGVWPQFRYWVFENNLLPGLRNHPAWWICFFPALYPLLVVGVARYLRRVSDPTIALRRGFVVLTFGLYILALWSFWPLVTRQDYLPFQPGAFVVYTAALLAIGDRLRGWPMRIPLPALASALELVLCVTLKPFWRNTARIETNLLRAVYRLTDPGDFVLDEKGETVFRQRTFAPIWETLMAERIRRGLVVDNAAERCIETHTCVARKGNDMSAAARQFIDKHFLPIGDGLSVAGSVLEPTAPGSARFDLDAVIPARYVIIAPGSHVTGILDGSPYIGARFLAAGRHTFVRTSEEAPLMLFWAQAAERNFSPLGENFASIGR